VKSPLRRTAPRRAFASTLLAAAALACASRALPQSAAPPAAAPAARPDEAAFNLVIVTLDTLRADHLGCYGYFRDTTPNLDALAKESLRFTRCYAPIAHTTPSHASLFTSVYPFEHGITANTVLKSEEVQRDAAFRPSPTLQTLAQALHAKGVATGGFVSAAPVKRITGLSVGFDGWSEPSEHRRPGHETIADALAWLDANGTRPFFLWVHLFDAHGPFDADYPPAEYRARYRPDDALKRWLAERRFPARISGVNTEETDTADVVDVYDGAVRYLDDQLAPLLARLGTPELREKTLLVVTADHGQGLGQHDFLAHGIVWSEQLNVPLLIRLPARLAKSARLADAAAGAVDAPLSTIDVVPTALARLPGLVDAAYLHQMQGSDVLADSFTPRAVFGMAPLARGLLAFTTSRWRLIHGKEGAPQLFDLEHDPFELEDVAAKNPEIAARLDRALLAEVERQKRREAIHERGAQAGGPPDPKHLEELEKLGYTSGDGADDGAAPPPKKKDGGPR
jgi:arylsulfatase